MFWGPSRTWTWYLLNDGCVKMTREMRRNNPGHFQARQSHCCTATNLQMPKTHICACFEAQVGLKPATFYTMDVSKWTGRWRGIILVDFRHVGAPVAQLWPPKCLKPLFSGLNRAQLCNKLPDPQQTPFGPASWLWEWTCKISFVSVWWFLRSRWRK